MARKKQEVALQLEIETQEEWEEMLSKEGLVVVDVYQEWAGPCKAMISHFRKLKNELGDDLLRFAIAKCDTIDFLEKYRGRCKPCFLFYAKDVLVYVQHGAMVPSMTKAIHEQLNIEHQVLNGQGERKAVTDHEFAEQDNALMEDDTEEEEDMTARKKVTVAILKPNVVAAGKVDEIIAKIEEQGIEILERKSVTMTKEDAEEFYSEKRDEEFFDKMIEHMTSGPSEVLVLSKGDTGEGIVEEWRDLLGPANVEEAKEGNPESLRAVYGEESFINAVHGSSSSDLAMQELAFFFPNAVLPPVQDKGAKADEKVERTLALIRPDVLKEKKDEILGKIEDAGFRVVMQKEMQLSRERAEEFYKEHAEQPYFEELITSMTNGPLLALALAREDAITGWRDMLGPKEVEQAKAEAPQSLRAQYSVEDVPVNQLHGSDSNESAQKELEYFFPMQQTVAVVKPDAYQTKDEIISKIKEAGFHIAARKETELTEDIAKEFYKEHADKEYYDDLTKHMSSGPTLFMVLSREDAVEGWRGLIGPVDPAAAKEAAPDTLRAQFGSDLKANAVHGSSNPDHAKGEMELIFGTTEFEAEKPEEKEATGEEKQAEGGETQAEGDAQPPPAEENQEAAQQEEQKAEETPQEPPKEEGEAEKAAEAPPAEEEKKEEAAEEPPKEEAQEEKKEEEAAPAAEGEKQEENAEDGTKSPAKEESAENAEKTGGEEAPPPKEGE